MPRIDKTKATLPQRIVDQFRTDTSSGPSEIGILCFRAFERAHPATLGVLRPKGPTHRYGADVKGDDLGN